MAFPTKKQITAAMGSIGDKIAEARQELESLRDSIQEEFDEKSEKWQEGDKGGEWQELLDEMEERIGSLEEIENYSPERPA